jgi:integrase
MARAKTAGLYIRIWNKEKQKQEQRSIEWLDDWRIKPPPEGGMFYLYWPIGNGKYGYKRLGSCPRQAFAALDEQQHKLSHSETANPAARSGVPATPKRRLYADAVREFLKEKSADTNDRRAVERASVELEDFGRTCTITYLEKIDRALLFDFMVKLKQRGLSPRSVYNRVSSIGTFLKKSGHGVNFKFVCKKKKGDIPNFVSPAPNFYTDAELSKLFAACNEEEKLWFKTFLFTGGREREIAHACWSDFELDNGVWVVQPHLDLGFCTKNAETRDVPIDDALIVLLRAHRDRHPNGRLLFPNTTNKPEGHFLAKLKSVAFHGGLNCGQCLTRRGVSCAHSPTCKQWTLHKFRRSWAQRQLESGVSSYELQDWIGHSDQAMLRTYTKNANARSSATRAKVRAAFAGLAL